MTVPAILFEKNEIDCSNLNCTSPPLCLCDVMISYLIVTFVFGPELLSYINSLQLPYARIIVCLNGLAINVEYHLQKIDDG